MPIRPAPRSPATPFATPFATSYATPFAWRETPASQAVGGSAIRELLKLTERPEVLSLAGGLPNPELFPVAAVADATARLLRDAPAAALQYGPTEGYQPLRAQIAQRMSERGRPTAADEVLITTGSQQALDLLGKALIAPGHPVAVANPTYLGAVQAFSFYQPRFLAIDPGRPSPLPSGTALLYLTPNFANPTGETLSPEQRTALVSAAADAGCPLVEDDPYGDLYFDAPPPAPLATLAPAQTAYLGSFSKVLAPGLRVGYVVAPRTLIAVLARLKQAADLHTASLDQRIVSALIADGTLDRHLPRLRETYRQQRDALAAAIDRHLHGRVRWQLPRGGMFFWLELIDAAGRRRSSAALLDQALASGTAFVPGAPFFVAAPRAECLRLSFATLAPAQMDEAMRRLAVALAELAPIDDRAPASPTPQAVV